MKEVGEDEKQVRRFLLGKLTEEEQQQVEENVVVDPEYRERVLIAEEDLIEDYLDGTLATEERERFEKNFSASHQQRLRVRIARLLGHYPTKKFKTRLERKPPAPKLPTSTRRWPIGFSLRNPWVFLPLAAVLLIVVALGVSNGIRVWRENNQRLEAEKQRLEVERELAQLNSPSNPDLHTSIFSVALPPVTVRGANGSARVSTAASVEIIEFQLILGASAYSSYTAELTKTGASERFTIPNLHAQSTSSGQAVAVRIPARLLTRGDYKLALVGVTDDGKMVDAGEYHFQMIG